GPLRVGQRRDAVSRRDRRDPGPHAGETPSGASGTRSAARGREQEPSDQRADHHRDEPGSDPGGGGQAVPGGFVLPPQGDGAGGAPAPPAKGRSASAGKDPPRGGGPPHETSGERSHRRRRRPAPRLSLARQCARAGERYGARRRGGDQGPRGSGGSS